MISIDEGDVLEKRLERAIFELDKQINDLQNERRTLENLLIKARKQGISNRQVTRKNSVSKILIETTIIEALQYIKRPLATKEIYRFVLTRDPTLKSTTFRSYLHRLYKNGQIVPSKSKRGVWSLCEKPDIFS